MTGDVGFRARQVVRIDQRSRQSIEDTEFDVEEQRRRRLPVVRGDRCSQEDLGNAILYFVSPASEWVTGECISISGGGNLAGSV